MVRLPRVFPFNSALLAACMLLSATALGCARAQPASVATTPKVALPVRIPADPKAVLYESRIVASRLANPRGILRLEDGSLLVAEAGTGDPNDVHTGRITRLVDRNADADYNDPGERSIFINHQPSVNILGRLAVNRDEVFGLADLATGGGVVLATVADPTKGSSVLRLDKTPGQVFTTTRDNANSIVFHPILKKWFAVQSFANTVVALEEHGPSRDVAYIDVLEQGQHAVPAAIAYEPSSGSLLVGLFSGQLGGDTAGSGIDFVRGSGKVIRVDPATGTMVSVVEGLNAPTDVAVYGNWLYIVEFCSDFREPVKTASEATLRVTHAGFARFSGRVLRVSLITGEAAVIARGLDLPTHILIESGERILVSEGQGSAGRMIPGPNGPTRLEGRLVELVSPRRHTNGG